MRPRDIGPVALLVAVGFLLTASRADAELQLRPFANVTFGVKNTFYDLDQAAGKPKLGLGVAGALLGNVLGIEADFGRMNRFYQSGRGGSVKSSSLTTLTGNATIALPRHLTEYTLRPYFVGGAGLIRVRSDNLVNFFDVSETMTAVDVGGGVTGFLTHKVGLNWDVRYFKSLRRGQSGVSFGPEQLSFWRANMALAFRY